MLQRWKVVCSYDGTDFSGWQSQPDGNAVQDFIEARLSEIMQQEVRITGSGRTDAGVHARGQVFHLDLDWNAGPYAMKKALEVGLPESIGICSIRPVNKDFHARFSAKGKRYHYRIYQGMAPPHLTRFMHSRRDYLLNVDAMNEAARCFVGWHDFRAFSVNRGEPYEDTRRYLSECSVGSNGPLITVKVEGNGFMYRMVRSLVGAIMDAADERLSLDEIRFCLKGENRSHRVVTAPAKGLTLERVYYRNRGYPNLPPP